MSDADHGQKIGHLAETDQVRIDPDLISQVGFHARACAMPVSAVVSNILRSHLEGLKAQPGVPTGEPERPASPVGRYSSRGGRLVDVFLRERLKGASELDRISGYFRSTLLHAIADDLSGLMKVRILCNAELDPRDILTARIANGAAEPLPKGDRFRTLLDLLSSGLVEVRVITEQGAPFLHGKAGVIRYLDGRTCTFSGSANDTLAAWKDNYEIVWEDFSREAADWLMSDFSELWKRSTPLDLAVSTLVQLPNGKLATIAPGDDEEEDTGGNPPPPPPPPPRVDHIKLPDIPDLENKRVKELLIGGETLIDPSPRRILSEALYQLKARLGKENASCVRLVWIHVGIRVSENRVSGSRHDDRERFSFDEPSLKEAILCAWKVARAIGERMQVDLITEGEDLTRLTYDPNEVSTVDRDEQILNPLHERPLVGPGVLFRVQYVDEGRFETIYVAKREQDPFIGRDIIRLGNGAPVVHALQDRMAGERVTLNTQRRLRLLDVWRPHTPEWG